MNDWFDAEQRVERARELFEQQKWEEALALLRDAVAMNPWNGSWHFNIGVVLDEMHRYSEAIIAYERALEHAGEDVETLNHLGIDLMRVGRLEDAVKAFEKIEKLDATYEPGYCNRIEAYAEMGQHEKAEEMFYMARLYKEQCPDCFYSMGVSLESRRLYDKAIFCWQKTLDLDEQFPQVHVRLAEAYWSKGELEKARQHFLRELRSSPGDTETLLDLGELLMEMRRLDEAGEKFRRAIELAPENPSGFFCHARWLEENGRIDEATTGLARVLELDPTYPGAHMLLGRIHHRLEREDKARFHLRKELMLRPEDPRMLLELSNLLMDTGEARAAVACLKRLTQIQPENADAWQNLAVALFLRNRFEEGVSACNEALRVDPRHAMALFNLALAFERRKRYGEAIEAVKRALEIAPNDPTFRKLELRLKVMRVKHKVGRWLKALWPFKK